jgi:hypothetical protein
MSQKGCETIKKMKMKIKNLFMFHHLNPWKSWQFVDFSSYECQGIQTKNPLDEIKN